MITPMAAWTVDPQLPHQLKCWLTTARILIQPVEIDKKWLTFINATISAMAHADASLNPHQMIQLYNYKKSAAKAINMESKILEIPLKSC